MKKTITIALAILFALAMCASCIRKDNNNLIPFVSMDNNYYLGQFVAQGKNYNPGPSAAQSNNYYLSPSVSVITGILTTQANVYALKTACPIKVSNNNIIVNNISMFQLTGCGPNAAPYVGSQIWLTGKFFLGCTANNDTQLMMEVIKFEAYTTVPVSECPPAATQPCNPQGYAQCSTQSYAQCDVQSYTQCNVQNPAQCNVQSSVQSSPQGYTQSSVQSSPQGYTQSSAQGKTPGGTQINTQINAQGNAQVNAQINIQSNAQLNAQGNTQSAGKSAPAVKKQPPKKPAPPCPPPKPKTYRIQIGAYCDPANAQKAVARLQCQNLNPVKEKYKQYTRVVLRGIPASKVENTLAAARRAGFCDFWKQLE